MNLDTMDIWEVVDKIDPLANPETAVKLLENLDKLIALHNRELEVVQELQRGIAARLLKIKKFRFELNRKYQKVTASA